MGNKSAKTSEIQEAEGKHVCLRVSRRNILRIITHFVRKEELLLDISDEL